MPPAKEDGSKHNYARSISSNGMSMSAKVFHQATNLMPASPPQSPTGLAPTFPPRSTTTSSWGRQNSCNGKYS